MSKVKKKVRMKKSFKILIVVILIFLCGGYIIFSNFQFTNVEKKENVVEKKEVRKTAKDYKAKVFMVGDALIHSAIYEDALKSDGTYDFTPILADIKPISSKYDLAYYNQETVLGGTSLGLSNYPRFNSPQEVGDAFVDAGFNMVSLATNHTMDKGEQGVLNSVAYWKSKSNVAASGQWSSEEERQASVSKVHEVNNIKYTFISYTIEYSFNVDAKQEEIANYLSGLGVDLIIGAHPHVIQTVEYINNNKTFVIYSLGNFVSDQNDIDNFTGLAMEVTLNKHIDIDDSVTNSVIEPKAELIYTTTTKIRGVNHNFKVVPYPKLTDNELNGYTNYYEKYKNIVNERYPNLVWGLSGE